MPLTRRDVQGLSSKMRDTSSYFSSERDMKSHTAAVNPVASTQLIRKFLGNLAGGAGTGYLAGRLGTTSVGATGIPLGLTVGVIGNFLAAFGIAGGLSADVANVANGAAAAWGAMWAAGQGSQARAQKGDTTPIVSGAAPMRQMAMNAARSVAPLPASIGFGPPAMFGAGTPFNVNQARPLSEAERQAMQQISRRVTR